LPKKNDLQEQLEAIQEQLRLMSKKLEKTRKSSGTGIRSGDKAFRVISKA